MNTELLTLVLILLMSGIAGFFIWRQIKNIYNEDVRHDARQDIPTVMR